nr:Multifunctional pyrimidine synthesis protein CAD [Polyrhizophydium stewartii]
MRPAVLRLQTGDVIHATSFGAPLAAPVQGEVVFTTSIVGYPESMTDPSYTGQILVFTQPLVGNYGVPAPTRDQFGLLRHFESDKIQVRGIIVNDYAAKYSHWNAIESLGHWCARHGVPAISGVDTRALVTLLRNRGSTLGEIRVAPAQPDAAAALATECRQNPPVFADPNLDNLVARVSTPSKLVYNKGGDIKVALVDCGAKQNIIRCLAKRGAEVTVVPWDYNLLDDGDAYDGIFISNGPGDPKMCSKAAANLVAVMRHQQTSGKIVPIFGICMGHQLLGIAAGFRAYKLPFGNRGHNQPALNLVDGSCVITSQNHGYALDDTDGAVPVGWAPYFRNANDGSNEGIRHLTLPYSSVQFHPEAMGGPLDTEFLFENFVRDVRTFKLAKQQQPQQQQPSLAVASASA